MTDELLQVVRCFQSVEASISSGANTLNSNAVLAHLNEPLSALGFIVETGKGRGKKIRVPVLFGFNDRIDKEFNADAVSADGRIVIEVEAGQALENNKYYKNIFQACMMHGVDYLVMAVREVYRTHYDFERIHAFLETLYISGRVQLPLKGILLIGY